MSKKAILENRITENLPKLLTPKDVGKYLNIGNTKLYEMIKRKDFPSFQLGGNYYVIEEDFIEWLKNQTKKLQYKV